VPHSLPLLPTPQNLVPNHRIVLSARDSPPPASCVPPSAAAHTSRTSRRRPHFSARYARAATTKLPSRSAATTTLRSDPLAAPPPPSSGQIPSLWCGWASAFPPPSSGQIPSTCSSVHGDKQRGQIPPWLTQTGFSSPLPTLQCACKSDTVSFGCKQGANSGKRFHRCKHQVCESLIFCVYFSSVPCLLLS
jgi:hypothetical protein